MDIRITPAPLRGRIAAPPSKSAAHRLLICGALADRPTRLLLDGSNEDLEATARCLEALGAGIVPFSGGVEVHPLSRARREGPLPCLDCGESGSTLRFLLPAALLLGGGSFGGHGRLPQRPLSPLREELEAHGARLSSPGSWPLEARGCLTPGHYRMAGNVSSQYFSGLLMALPLLDGDSVVEFLPPLESAGYVEMTLRAMARFGVRVEPRERGWRVPGRQAYRSPGEIRVEGDWSGAAFWLAAGALGGPVGISGLEMDTAQGDRAMMALTVLAGAEAAPDGGMLAVRRGRLFPLDVDVSQIPDLVPALAALAVLTPGTTRLRGAARLRDKESDRLAALADSLGARGAHIRQLPDGLEIRGQESLPGGVTHGWQDHRIVMAAAVAAAGCRGPVVIRDVQAVAKSYPGFFEDYRKLGGRADVIHNGE